MSPAQCGARGPIMGCCFSRPVKEHTPPPRSGNVADRWSFFRVRVVKCGPWRRGRINISLNVSAFERVLELCCTLVSWRQLNAPNKALLVFPVEALPSNTASLNVFFIHYFIEHKTQQLFVTF